ncbi:hypothetical protein Dfri01_14230 [Dyadobacter frigoris]|nr:hypothetical protein Dfri01_14230 [Dyadobacter frigoris]
MPERQQEIIKKQSKIYSQSIIINQVDEMTASFNSSRKKMNPDLNVKIFTSLTFDSKF